MEKWVYLFTEGHKDMRDLLGGKGADLDYVSCSPYRVLAARLAAAQAVLGTIARDK